MHRQVDRVGAEEGAPEVDAAHRVIEHPAGDLRIPVIDGAEDDQDRRHAHHHVKVRHYEVRVRQRNVDRHVAEEEARQPAVDEGEHEADREQHRHGEVDVASPQCQHPVVDLDRGRHGDDQRRGGEEEAEVRVHAAHVHVMRPDHEGKRADRQDRPHHHAVAEDVPAGMRADQVGDDSERRQRDDVDLGVPEEPEQVLEEERAAARVLSLLAHRYDGRHEEARADLQVERHHHGAHEQCREGEQGQDRGHEDAPDRERHPHHRHAAAARLQHRHDVVKAAHREADDEDRERHEHQGDAPVGARGAARDRLRRVERPAGAGGPARHEEARDQHEHRQQVHPVGQHVQVREHHVPRAALERDQQIPEPAQEQRREQVDHHDHPVHGDELVIVVGADEAEGVGEAELHPHHHRQRERHEPDPDRGDRVLDRDDLVVLAPDVLRDEGLRIVQVCVLVRDCDVCHQKTLRTAASPSRKVSAPCVPARPELPARSRRAPARPSACRYRPRCPS